MIVSFGILNKASGFYGLASLLTGHPISAMEWILNIWSLVLLSIFVLAYLAIRNRQALTILAFAHFYVVDTLFSVAFTIFFCVKWFKVQHSKTGLISDASSAIYSAVAARNSNATLATLEGASASKLLADSASLSEESALSIVFTVLLLLARIYFTFVIIGYARQIVCQQNLRRYNGTPRGSWAYTLQSILLGPFESFWTGFTSSSSSLSPLARSAQFSDDYSSDRTPLTDSKFGISESSSVSSL